VFQGVAERCLVDLETLFANHINGLSDCQETLCNAMETLSIQNPRCCQNRYPPPKGGGNVCNGWIATVTGEEKIEENKKTNQTSA
jgi:hypothetical protein